MKILILNEKNGNRLEEYQTGFLHFFKLTKEDLKNDEDFKNESSMYFRNPDKLKKIILDRYGASNRFFNGFSCSQFAGRVASVLALNGVAFRVCIGLERWNDKEPKEKLIGLMDSKTFNCNHVWLVSNTGAVYEHNGDHDKAVYYLGYYRYDPDVGTLKSNFSKRDRKVL